MVGHMLLREKDEMVETRYNIVRRVEGRGNKTRKWVGGWLMSEGVIHKRKARRGRRAILRVGPSSGVG